MDKSTHTYIFPKMLLFLKTLTPVTEINYPNAANQFLRPKYNGINGFIWLKPPENSDSPGLLHQTLK